MNSDYLIELLIRILKGDATEKEKEQFERWLEENPSRRRKMISRLQNRRFLQGQYARWDAIDVERPKLQMKRTIRPRGRAVAWVLGAAAATLAVVLLLQHPRTEQPAGEALSQASRTNYIGSIVPGREKATLTQSDGTEVDLKGGDILLKSVVSPATPPSRPSQDTPKARTSEENLKGLALNVLRTPRGGEFHIILEDSTEVWLNADSSLEYPETFAADERRVKVTGEAYFKVHRDTGRPFLVGSAGQLVRVYGTEFNVSSYPEDSQVRTTLVSGKIGICPEDMSSSVLYLTPGHQAVFSKAEERISINPVNARVVTSWKDGMFVFENQTLAQIMVQLSRWYDFDYEFADDEAPAIQFKGRVHRYGAFTDLIEILEKAGGIRFSARDDKIVITALPRPDA